jgi:hypothetical protein
MNMQRLSKSCWKAVSWALLRHAAGARARQRRVGLVLAWFALSLGVAIASPLIHPKSIELVCSSAGAMKLVTDGDAGPGVGTLDCPLCLPLESPPPAIGHSAGFHCPGAPASRQMVAARVVALAAAALPARGPPAF